MTLVNLLPRAVQTLAVGALAGLQGRAADVALTTLVNRGRWGAGLRNYTFMGSGEMEAFAVRGKYCREHLRSVAQKSLCWFSDVFVSLGGDILNYLALAGFFGFQPRANSISSLMLSWVPGPGD